MENKKVKKLTSVSLTNFNLELYLETQFFVISGVDYPGKHTEIGKKKKKILVTWPWRHAYLKRGIYAENGIPYS